MELTAAIISILFLLYTTEISSSPGEVSDHNVEDYDSWEVTDDMMGSQESSEAEAPTTPESAEISEELIRLSSLETNGELALSATTNISEIFTTHSPPSVPVGNIVRAPPTANVCNGLEGCKCFTSESPIIINCARKNLASVYPENELKLTFDSLNILEFEMGVDLRLDQNHIEFIPKFPSLPIYSLNISHNQITDIDPSAFRNLTQVEILDLSYNNLSLIKLGDDIFDWYEDAQVSAYFPLKLTYLSLAHNQISYIDNDALANFPNLSTLDLSHNPLHTINAITFMGRLTNLQSLYLSHTGLSTLNSSLFIELLHLIFLDLSGNQFETVPHIAARNLQKLILDDNKITSLGRFSFLSLQYLEFLSLRNNSYLTEVSEGTFRYSENLNTLDMSFCERLTEISQQAFQGMGGENNGTEWKLKTIHLNDNNLTKISERLLLWDKVEYLDISNNPFNCDCGVEWMLTGLLPLMGMRNPEMLKNIRCSEPEHLKENYITDLYWMSEAFENCETDLYVPFTNLTSSYFTPTGFQLNSTDIGILAGTATFVVVILLVIVGFRVYNSRRRIFELTHKQVKAQNHF